MGIETVLDMAAMVHGDRAALGPRLDGRDFSWLDSMAKGVAAWLTDRAAQHVAFLGLNGPTLPVLLFGAARAGIPLVPLNYRLPPEKVVAAIAQLTSVTVVADRRYLDVLRRQGVDAEATEDVLAIAQAQRDVDPLHSESRPDDVAVVLFTSGTTSRPKGVLLRHRNLLAYVFGTVEFGSANAAEAVLVSTPPYHIAGLGTVLSNVHAGRRMVYLPEFDPDAWLQLVRDEEVTSAMLVPTMLARILDRLDGSPPATPSLRSLAYGGARMPLPVIERALEAFPQVDFVNAYGLTETSSTIALLGPEDHRAAATSADPVIRRRLASAGQLVPGIEAAIRDSEGRSVPDGELGYLWVRGDQVTGDYLEGAVTDRDGWFPTRDLAHLEGSYLFVEGRADDTIIRGAENIAPAEIEDVLLRHPAIREVAVVGVTDDEWGQRIAAAVVRAPDADPLTEGGLRAWARQRLRGARTPDDVLFVDELPHTDTGKLARRHLVSELEAGRHG